MEKESGESRRQDDLKSGNRFSAESLMDGLKVRWEGGEKRRLRLVIAIPALMILITLSAGIIGYEFILDIADTTESLIIKTKLEHAANVVLLANFIACGVALVFGVGLATYIVRPIRVLTQRARTMVKGDVSQKLSISNPDEIGDLSESFNSLIDHLNSLFRERDRYILEGFAEGLISLAPEGEILAANTQAEKIIGLPAKSMIGKNIKSVLGDQEKNTIINDILAKSLRLKSSFFSDKLPFVNSLNNLFDLSISISPIHDKNGKWIGCIISMRDLSLLANFTEQIEHADRLAAIGSFATGIAHELRNPLGSIKGVAQLLSELQRETILSNSPEYRISSTIDKYSKLIIGEVDRLDQVIRTILDFAQPEPEEKTPIDLNPLLLHAIHFALHHPSMEDRHSQLKIEKSLGDLPLCAVQKRRITQAFSNIILNAFQSVVDEGIVRVESRAHLIEDNKKEIEILIVNDGPPIPEDLREKIFEPFYTTKPQGTGLGLPISYQIIVSNGGSLDFDCENGKTTFFLRFPALESKDKTVSDVSPGSAYRETSSPNTE
ncbi:HAMP domain-containing protein [Candidatus Sumerlaeota bacterium]|nr:HAMP domain-containing protein [Candidatus Sumerlaeota bacterium]